MSEITAESGEAKKFRPEPKLWARLQLLLLVVTSSDRDRFDSVITGVQGAEVICFVFAVAAVAESAERSSDSSTKAHKSFTENAVSLSMRSTTSTWLSPLDGAVLEAPVSLPRISSDDAPCSPLSGASEFGVVSERALNLSASMVAFKGEPVGKTLGGSRNEMVADESAGGAMTVQIKGSIF